MARSADVTSVIENLFSYVDGRGYGVDELGTKGRGTPFGEVPCHTMYPRLDHWNRARGTNPLCHFTEANNYPASPLEGEVDSIAIF